MEQAVVLIIAHKEYPTDSEISSLVQCAKVLGSHRIVLVCPLGLNVGQYKRAFPEIEVDFIEPKWQRSYAMFNRLKIEPFLYKRYSNHRFILFYELDAWVFSDELDYWCDQDFDFIGAPWFESYNAAGRADEFLGVGNGGFSLRKVQSHLRALKSFGFVRSPKIIAREFLSNMSFQAFGNAIQNLTVRNNTFFLFNDYRFNEDHFWGRVVAKKFSWFRTPDLAVASRFSMELNASFLYELNNCQLPFGCHKWEKYQPEFWQQFISKGGTRLP